MANVAHATLGTLISRRNFLGDKWDGFKTQQSCPVPSHASGVRQPLLELATQNFCGAWGREFPMDCRIRTKGVLAGLHHEHSIGANGRLRSLF